VDPQQYWQVLTCRIRWGKHVKDQTIFARGQWSGKRRSIAVDSGQCRNPDWLTLDALRALCRCVQSLAE
jgi:hypothetical protein